MRKLISSALALAGLMALGIASPASASSVIYDLTFATSSGNVTGVLTLSYPSLAAVEGLGTTDFTASNFVSLTGAGGAPLVLDGYSFDFTVADITDGNLTGSFKTDKSTAPVPGEITALTLTETEPAGDIKPAKGATPVPFLKIFTSTWTVDGLNNSIIASGITGSVDHSAAPTFDAPEPSTLPILASGLALLGFAGFMVRRRKLNLSAATA